MNQLTEQAKQSPRLRINFDLRNSVDDKSQRMLIEIKDGAYEPLSEADILK